MKGSGRVNNMTLIKNKAKAKKMSFRVSQEKGKKGVLEIQTVKDGEGSESEAILEDGEEEEEEREKNVKICPGTFTKSVSTQSPSLLREIYYADKEREREETLLPFSG